MPAPIELQFYGENDEPIGEPHRRSIVPFGMLKKAVILSEQMKDRGTAEQYDLISTFMVEFFGDKFSVSDLEDHTDMSEVFAAFYAIQARARQLSGPENFR